MANVRPAAVAGMFYPRDRAELAREIVAMLQAVHETPLAPGWPKGLVVPHAGYVYSGPIAANAYALLRPAAGIVERVVLLGPCHRVAVRGLALPAATAFETPLGRVEIDEAATRAIRVFPQVSVNAATHAYEHSLEVQLPFLQEVLGRFKLVPLVVGDATVGEVAEVLDALWGGPGTLIVISSDLSHYHAYDEARTIDDQTVRAILDCNIEIDHMQACGATPLTGFLAVAQRRDLERQLLDVRNSGDTAGDRTRVVGYAAVAFWQERLDYGAVHGRTLIRLARDGVIEALGGPGLVSCDEAWLMERRASFVTLMQGERLRGCIGSLEATRPLGEDVVKNAVAAALSDRRFAPLALSELAGITLEVSLLSVPMPIAFSDEDELFEMMRVGIDGILLEHGGARATYLPQVWEHLPEPRAFLASLIQKAGLPVGTPLARCKISRYQVKKWRETQFQVH
jgi:MEMO1 family protein